jgi:hypothetical protein
MSARGRGCAQEVVGDGVTEGVSQESIVACVMVDSFEAPATRPLLVYGCELDAVGGVRCRRRRCRRDIRRDLGLPPISAGTLGVGFTVSLSQVTLWSSVTGKDSRSSSASTAATHSTLPAT